MSSENIIQSIEERISSIRDEFLLIIDNQTLSLTEKNIKLEPLKLEDFALKKCLQELENIKNTNFAGKCKV